MDLSKITQLDGFISANGAFDPRTFLLSSVTVGEAAAVSLLFWPQFTEYRGGVFLKFLFEEQAVDNWFGELKGDLHAVESVVNHVHLWDAIVSKSSAEYQVLSELAIRVGEMWMAALGMAFPAMRFLVTVTDEDTDYGPTISFHSV
ncbi:hypothetical protein [Acrocarpospora catenulata]|uniref:hypothetical protein n=1 Tax=Acrocarpospora catenulata TaxID=2836182 RepID=UPI001BDA38A2|nr:hypothetical protein [Acrocarpospora catenulata]